MVVASVGAFAQGAPTVAKAADERFDIGEFRVLGNSLLANRAIERAVYPFLGPNGNLEEVRKAVASLEKAYKDAGYGTIFVDIPEQSVDAGVVRLQVTEGRLDRVRLSGARYFSDRHIRAALPALQPAATPNLQTFQQQLTQLNSQSSDLSVTPVLKPGGVPGTVDVDLKVRDAAPVHASVEMNDRYSANTTPNRLVASAGYDNLWQLNHGLSLLYQWAPAKPSEAEVGAATYLLRSQSASALWAISVIHTNSDVAAVGTLGVLGKGTIYGAHWIDPIVNTESASHTVTLGVDVKAFTQSVQLSGSPGLGTPITYANWLAQYSGAWRLPSRSFTFSASIGFGIRDLVNRPDEFEAGRFDAPADYFYVRSSGQVEQTLPLGFSALVRYTGQWVETPLVNYEQLAIGGVDTVRGYVEAEALGDAGAAGTIELHTPPVGDHWGRMLHPLYAFVFGDVGVVTLHDALPNQEARTHLGSFGVGLRLENPSALQTYLDYARPLVTGPYTRRGDSRFDFSVRYGF